MGIANRSLERPGEWLLELMGDPTLYRQLVDEVGLAIAAHHVARARCEVRGIGTKVPTMTELAVAAREIVARGELAMTAPPPMALVDECEASGLLVISPARRAA